jgi:hypothetical protein
MAGKRLRRRLTNRPSSLLFIVLTLCVSSPLVEILDKEKFHLEKKKNESIVFYPFIEPLCKSSV